MNALTLPEGFMVRSATLNDVDIVANLFTTHSLATAGVEDVSAEQRLNFWQSPDFNPVTDIQLVFTNGGQLVACVEVWIDARALIRACVHPNFVGKGLGTYITAWGEERCRQAIDMLPADLRLTARVDAYSTDLPAHQLFKEMNWTYDRSFYTMRIDMDSTPPMSKWPERIDLRPYASEHLPAIYSAHREAFRDHFGHVEVSFESGLEEFKSIEDRPQYDPDLWFVAWDGNEVAGYCQCQSVSPSDHEAGFINIIGVRRAWRKHGLGLALLQHAFGKFHQRGQTHMELGVDAKNLTGALRLYEKAGMHIHVQIGVFEKELRPGREMAVESM